jgi:ribonuclease Z
LAQKIQVKKLLLGHFSSRYDDISLFESEAQTIIPEVYAVRDGDCFSVV